jgi:heterodisulfide reductase subunit C
MALPLGIDFEFRKLIMDVHVSSEKIKYCYQCSRCTDNCPVAEVQNPFYKEVTNSFDPRLIVLVTLLGYKDVTMAVAGSKAALIPWGCTVCDTCDTVCPQAIEVTEIILFLKMEKQFHLNLRSREDENDWAYQPYLHQMLMKCRLY